jgi:NDP-mannose synthase
MKAVIMAGGRGTRLAPFTKVLPKPLIPLGDYPILEIIICQLREAGFDDIVLTVNYLAHLFEAYFGNGERQGVKIRYSLESEPLGTAGPLSLIEGLDEEPFLVMNADLLTDIDFRHLYRTHEAQQAAITMALYAKEYKIDFGVIETDDTNRVLRCAEKPVLNYQINMGVYVLSPSVLRHTPYNRYINMTDVIERVMKEEHGVYGYKFGGTWMDLGKVDDFDRVASQFQHLAEVADARIPLESYISFLTSASVPVEA